MYCCTDKQQIVDVFNEYFIISGVEIINTIPKHDINFVVGGYRTNEEFGC